MQPWIARAVRLLAVVLCFALPLQLTGPERPLLRGHSVLFARNVAFAQIAGQAPYGGTPWAIPGRIETENYDTGGEGAGYHDKDAVNRGGAYRSDGVDIKTSADTGGGYAVGWFNAGEWLEYTVNVAQTGTYDIQVRVGSAFPGRTFHIEFNGVNKTGSVAVPQLPGWDQYQTVTIPGVTLNAGTQLIRLVMGSLDYMDVNWISVRAAGQAPYGGTPWAIPGRIEAENYDTGGEGIAYHDVDASNRGGAYRSDGVDIKTSADTGGGYAVGWFNAGEWLEYTVNVAQPGTYDIQVRVGSAFPGRTFHIEFNGLDRTGSITVPVMPGWDQYQTITIYGVALSAGAQVMRIVTGPLDYMDVNWVNISATPACASSLQSLVNAATPGSTVSVPACIYRETATISKLLTLVAQPGAEIRGSAVWTTGWVKNGAYWLHPGVPSFPANGFCQPGTSRCLWPEQVFYNGTPLEQVASNPTSGQFAVTADRTLILADDPTGRVVEVTVRQYWIVVASDGVTVRGFIMRHAANNAQDGAMRSNGYTNITIEGNTMSDAHGAIVTLSTGSNLRLLNNVITRGGQQGVHMSRPTDALVQGNMILNNNTERFDFGWEAGGLKSAFAVRYTLDSNVVGGNDGPGLWCDIACREVTYSNNRVYNNSHAGIFFEISTGAKIFGNKVWNNGWLFSVWGWGAGILASSSSDVEIYNNVVAWNADGISIISQSRGDAPSSNGTGHSVHDNTVVMEDGADAWGLAWLQDWGGPMFAPTANNSGLLDRFGYSGFGETGSGRFTWGGTAFSVIDSFALTPGGQGSFYIIKTEQDATLTQAGIPLIPPPRP